MRMIEVRSESEKQEFLQLAVSLYRNDPNWIQPLDKDINAVFDPAQNKFFKKGVCSRWLLKNGAGKTIGRIAAFVNPQYKNEQPTGGVGFFECINDREAAHFMFDHCREWLREKGMEAMDGPINFGERLAWWGLLVDGFHSPLYQMNYNHPYYQDLFESYGFQLYFNQVCFARETEPRLSDKFYERHSQIAADPNYKAVYIDKTKLDKFAKDFSYIYNKAWAGHGGGKEIEERVARKMFQQMKPVMDEHITWFVYYKEEPVALWVNLPDMNQWFRHLRGQFGLLDKLKFLLIKKFATCDRFVGLVFGVIPEFQGKGVDAYMVVEAAKVIQARKKYLRYEMQWIGDFNPKMINIAESLETTRNRRLTTYRFLFDREKPFKRHPMLG